MWGEKAGRAKGFLRYSELLRKSGVTWNDKTLDHWLTSPERLILGNAMTFPGIKDPNLRHDMIAYLKAVSEGKAPAPVQQRGMMMGRSERANLKRRPVLIPTWRHPRHCRDTYTVTTASGATHKIWKFNLRLKTNSSEYGLSPGKPVITGSDMMGDRASVVVASPAEISVFVKETSN